jgi:HAE1 family hydrophobic/amphiphilic exporter-1
MGMVNLRSWGERKTGMEAIIRQLEQKTRNIGDALIQYFPPPTIPGFGNASGFEIRVLDKSGSDDLTKTATVTNEFIEALNRTPEIAGAFSTFDASFPQYMIAVDQAVAAQKGVTIDKAMSTLQTLMGSYYASNFIRFGQMYKVMVQASPEYRTKPEDILKVHVKNEKGEMVPLSTFVRLQSIHGPEQLTRYNMYTSAMITGDAASGFSSGQAIEAIARTAKDKLPRGYSFDWSGMTREQILSGNQAVVIFLICLVFVYLLLAAQYESFLLPLAVILSLPAGILGSFFFLKIAGLENNIYAQVALVMLIGLLGKNAILIVEFAVQRQKEGSTVLAAAVEGAKERLRPILMTSFAFVAGLLPLCFADGAGALGNRSIGTAAAGGMLFGTIFGVVLVPGLYVLFATLRRPRKSPVVIAAFLVLILVGAGCHVPAKLTIPPQPTLPASFGGNPDTNSIANLPIRQFFPDTNSIAIIPIRQFFPDPNLQRLIDTALHNNPDLQMALSRIQIAAANVRFSKAALAPEVDAVVALSKYRNGDNTLNGVATDHFVGLRSNWEVDLWGKLKGRKKAAVARWLATQEGSRLVTTSLVAQVAALYYDLLALDNELQVIQRNIQLQENALEVVKVQKEAGRATELAVQQFQAQLYHTQGLRYSTAQQIVETENRMNFLTGRMSGPIPRDSSLLAVPVPAQVSAGVPAQLLLNRPDIREAELQLQAAHADIAAARAAFFPSLVLSPYAGFNAFKLEQLFNVGSLVWGLTGAALTPLINRGPIRADYARATAESQVAWWDYRRTVLGGYQEVENSLKGIHNYSEYLRLKQQEAASLGHAVSVANDLYLVGKASYLEVITAQRSVLDAELEVTGARKEILMQVVSLYRGVGGGWR